MYILYIRNRIRVCHEMKPFIVSVSVSVSVSIRTCTFYTRTLPVVQSADPLSHLNLQFIHYKTQSPLSGSHLKCIAWPSSVTYSTHIDSDRTLQVGTLTGVIGSGGIW
ncbi:uncharacterized protein YALI1_A16944g [Yarrowia lipolytica]|uniref:Uncharacterized protein n=1 Tax=Yarrowia lipolytica TaxID=4952 RepID=A0A1D8N545_YARLL|nr:hypothetical protein YALI1_A16944g [Yarrowia lipolytica]